MRSGLWRLSGRQLFALAGTYSRAVRLAVGPVSDNLPLSDTGRAGGSGPCVGVAFL